MYTIVIPYRNGHKTIDRLLDTLPDNIPVIIVDDMSDICSSRNYDNTITIHHKERGYFSGAVNTGINACDTDVLILNQDVWFPDGFPSQLIDRLAQTYGCFGDGVFGNPKWPKGYVQGTFMYTSRGAIEKTGLFDEENFPLWGSTADWQCRMCRQGFKAYPIDKPDWLSHEERKGSSFGASITEALKQEPEKKNLFIRTPPLVSVVVSCYNYGRYLSDLVNSLMGGKTCLGEMEAQTFQSFEIVIVDDASIDDSLVIAQSLADDWKGIRVISHKENKGCAAGHNTGIKAAWGEYIAVMGADDMMESWRLEEMYKAALAHPHSVIYDDMRIVTRNKRMKKVYLENYDFCRTLCANQMHAGLFFPRRAWVEAGGYPEVMTSGREDWAFNVGLGKAGWYGYRLVERHGYLYRKDGQNRTLHNTTGKWHSHFLGQLTRLYPTLYRKDNKMGCSGCGGGKPKRAVTVGPDLSKLAASLPGSQGVVQVQYVGTNHGRTQFVGAVSGVPYKFGLTRPIGNVDIRDLQTNDYKKPGLLQLTKNGARQFQLVETAKPHPQPEPEPIPEPEPETLIENIELSVSIKTKLAASGFNTVESLPEDVTSISGIGASAATKITEAINA